MKVLVVDVCQDHVASQTPHLSTCVCMYHAGHLFVMQAPETRIIRRTETVLSPSTRGLDWKGGHTSRVMSLVETLAYIFDQTFW
jgi:hypothetical protein